MARNLPYKWLWLVLGAGVLLAFPATAWAHGPSDGGANADAVKGLFTITLWLAIPIFLLVEGLLFYAILRYRRRSNDENPEQVHGNIRLEIAWTTLAFAVIAVLFVVTVRALQTDYEVKAEDGNTDPELTVHVTGYMFNWDYEYFIGIDEETGVKTTRELKIPAGRRVLLEITSSDVQHSFWVPKLAGKVDAVPGYVNTMWLQVDKPGTYTGQCAEYCGLNHYAMLIDVTVMEPEAFDSWIAKKEATASETQPMGTDMDTPLPDGDAGRGETIFGELACSACHGDKDQPSGPAVLRMMEDAKKREGYTAEQHLRESILMPCEYLAEGWEQCIMPQDYGTKLDAQALADLIEYLKQE